MARIAASSLDDGAVAGLTGAASCRRWVSHALFALSVPL